MSVRSIPTLCWSVAAQPSPLGVKMHDAGYAALGLNYKYVAFGSEDIAPIVQAVRTLGVRGLGVSMPHKQSVIDLLDSTTDAVKAIGACNTVVNTDGTLIGHNTDWQGAARALSESGLSDCSSALIVGSGGVARAIAYALKQQLGMSVAIAARKTVARDRIVNEIGLDRGLSLDEQSSQQVELIVNATPDSRAVDLDGQRSLTGVLDVVFQTRATPLILQAESRGLRAAPGWRMLLHQGAAQYELYTGQLAPLAAMAAVLESALPTS